MPNENNLSDIIKEVEVPVVPVQEPTVVPTPVVVAPKPEPVVVVPKEEFVKIPDVESVVNYNKMGEATEDSREAIVAKKIISGKTETFKLAFFGSSLYNPVGPFSTREKAIKNSFKYLEVEEEEFKSFLTFLETKNLNTYYTINRKVLNNV